MDLFFGFQLCKIAVHGAQADVFFLQRRCDLVCGELFVRVLFQILQQGFSLFCGVHGLQSHHAPICDSFANHYNIILPRVNMQFIRKFGMLSKIPSYSKNRHEISLVPVLLCFYSSPVRSFRSYGVFW